MPVLPATDYLTLSAMITPALFMTANGSLIISTSNRMTRIVDRIRQLNDASDRMWRGETGLDFLPERQAHIEDQLRHLVHRADLIRMAMVILYVSFASFVGTSLTLAVDQLLAHRIVALPTGMAVIGVSLMFLAAMNLAREAVVALHSNRLEIRFFHELQTRRRAQSSAHGPAPERLDPAVDPGFVAPQPAPENDPPTPASDDHTPRRAGPQSSL